MVTLLLCQQFAIENGPVEIVDFPSYKMVIFHSKLCGCLPEGNQKLSHEQNTIPW